MDPVLKSIKLNSDGIDRFNQNRLKEAIALYKEALDLNPVADYTYNNLALALYCYGCVEEAADYSKRALRHEPNNLNAWSNLLYYLNYRESDPRTLYDYHLEYARRVLSINPETQEIVFPNSPQPGRPLRIGYVSPDFKGHSVAYFIEPVLMSHDRAQFELFGYSNVAHPDAHTERFHTIFDNWREIHGLSDEEVGHLIQADGIDILVDLAGHTSQNRLGVFSRRWAPIQMTWLGYFNTTGLPTIDYLISDPISSPMEDKQPFSEALLRLPNSRLCYQPPEYAPTVSLLPCLKGPFTFGCFNNIAKHSDETLHLWARILKGVPNSRLLLKASAFGNEDVRQRYHQFFESQGVDPTRLILRGLSPHPAMLREYAEVDIALDPFPFTGGLTTCEALWQGVPVLTFSGKSLISRQSASFLSALGLDDWISYSVEEYEQKAISLADKVCSLMLLRARLRRQMKASSICDRKGFTRELELLYRQAWQRWCVDGRI